MRNRHHSRRSRVLAPLALAVVLGATAPAAADLPGRFSVVRFRPAMTFDGLFTSEAATTLGHLRPAAGLFVNFARRPAALDRAPDIVTSHVGFEFLGAVGLWDRLEVGLGLPIIAGQGGDDLTTRVHGGLGDLRLHLKGRIWARDWFRLGLSMPVDLPTGSDKNFLGNPGVAITPTVLTQFFYESIDLTLDVGYRLRSEKVEVAITPERTLVVDDELVLSGGIRVRAIPNLMHIVVDGQLAVGIKEQDPDEVQAEIWVGVRFLAPWGLSAEIGAGPGFGEGLGTPSARMFAGVRWQLDRAADADGDGVPDLDDRCPAAAEDHDGYQDDDGCPDIDHDHDGIPEDKDRCPLWAEDKDGFRDEDGCPEADNDGDNILDADDKCPNQAEDLDDFEDEDGCPDPDNDKDGVLDRKDDCPLNPETINGYADEDGCPDDVPSALRRFTGTIRGIGFGSGQTVVRASSRRLLDQAAGVLRAHPELKLLIRGHTDDRGDRQRNVKLSLQRAESVKRYLVGKGVGRDRLLTEGVGPAEPLESNDTKAGRANNRRIEFKLQK